jgi:hypothetical protein
VPSSEVCPNSDIPQLLQLFLELLDVSQLQEGLFSSWYRRIWTPSITLWYMIWQRLCPGQNTLEAVVADARRGGADSLCPPGARPVSEKIISLATAAYTKARQRLSLAWVKKAFSQLAFSLEALLEKRDELPCRLLDGSTVRLRPHPKVLEKFPRHRQKNCYWTAARILVCFGAVSGVVLGAVIGSSFVSEQALAVQFLLGMADRAIYIGDSNFGIWRVVRAAVQTNNHVLVRLTWARAKALAKGKARLRFGLDHSIEWSPTDQDQVDTGLEKKPIEGRLLALRIQRPGFRTRLVFLFTTLTDKEEYPPSRLWEMYGSRWQAELNLRSIKTRMNLAQLEVKSPDLVEKEILTGLMAYNLVRGLMCLAARQAGVTPQKLSFSQIQKLLASAVGELWLTFMTPAKREERMRLLLKMAARAKLPKRKKKRISEPRAFWRVPPTYPRMRISRVASRKSFKKKWTKS